MNTKIVGSSQIRANPINHRICGCLLKYMVDYEDWANRCVSKNCYVEVEKGLSDIVFQHIHQEVLVPVYRQLHEYTIHGN